MRSFALKTLSAVLLSAMAGTAFAQADIADAARAALPLRGAGFVDTAAQRILLRHKSRVIEECNQ